MSSKKVVKKFVKKVVNNVNQYWVPVSRQQLKHKIHGRSVYAAKFKARKYYDFDDIRQFAEKTRLKMSQHAHNIQITYQYKCGKTYGNKMTAIDEPIDMEDYRHSYNEDYGEIIGFTILLS